MYLALNELILFAMLSFSLGLHFKRSMHRTSRLTSSLSQRGMASASAGGSHLSNAVMHPSYKLVETSRVNEYGILASLYVHKKTGICIIYRRYLFGYIFSQIL